MNFDRLASKLQAFQTVDIEKKPDLEAAVSLCLVLKEKDPLLLMIKRTEKESDPWSGHYAFPGGRRCFSDSDLERTAKRETYEEVDLDLESPGVRKLGALDQVYTHKTNCLFVVHAFVYACPQLPQTMANPNEVQSIHWFSLRELASQKNLAFRQFKFEKLVETLPCLVLENEERVVIWGLSYVILGDLLSKWDGEQVGDLKIEMDYWAPYTCFGAK